jgi:hypothetical protein
MSANKAPRSIFLRLTSPIKQKQQSRQHFEVMVVNAKDCLNERANQRETCCEPSILGADLSVVSACFNEWSLSISSNNAPRSIFLIVRSSGIQ